MLEVFNSVFSIFAVIGVGFLCNKTKILPDEATPYMTSMLISVCTPAMIISSLAGREINSEIIVQTIEVAILTVAAIIVSVIIAYFAVKLMKYEPAEDRGVIMCIMTTLNSGFMGFPVTLAIFGDEVLYLLIIENMVLNIYMYSFLLIQLNYGSGEKINLKRMLTGMINIPIIATLIGLVILFGQITLPSLLSDILELLSDMTVPLSMLLVGVQLGSSKIKELFTNYKLLISVVISLTVIPVAVFLMVNWLPVSDISKLTIVFASCFPTAVVTGALAEQEHKNTQLCAQGITLTTLLSLVAIPVAAMVLSQVYLI